jgi:hypothetical protein
MYVLSDPRFPDSLQPKRYLHGETLACLKNRSALGQHRVVDLRPGDQFSVDVHHPSTL